MGKGIDDRFSSGIGDVLKGLGSLLNIVTDMADTDTIKKSFSGDLLKSGSNQGLQGKYNFSVKLGLQDEDVEQIAVEPEVIIPQADIFKENERMIVILELPGVTLKTLNHTVNEKTLSIEGIGDRVIYRKEIDMDQDITAKQITVTEKNGIFKIVISKND